MDASRLRTMALQELQSRLRCQSQTTVPSDDPTRAHGTIEFEDGSVYRVDVTRVQEPRQTPPMSWDQVFDGNSRNRN